MSHSLLPVGVPCPACQRYRIESWREEAGDALRAMPCGCPHGTVGPAADLPRRKARFGEHTALRVLDGETVDLSHYAR